MQVLSDEALRAKYDELGLAALDESATVRPAEFFKV